MVSVPLKPEYRPTLGQLLSPRWHRTSPGVKGLAIAGAVGLVILVIALVATLLPARISYGGQVPFHFNYKGLYRSAPDPGGYVKVQRHKNGHLEDSFSVMPLHLPAYQGNISGELPLYASGYIRSLAGHYAHFELQGEGKTRVNTVPAYNIYYSVQVDGRPMYGRDVLLLPERPGVREGVDIVMLTATKANSQVSSSMSVAATGVLYTPLRTFSFD